MNRYPMSESIEIEESIEGSEAVLAHYILERDDAGNIKRNYTAPGETPASALSNLTRVVTAGSLPTDEKEEINQEINDAIITLTTSQTPPQEDSIEADEAEDESVHAMGAADFQPSLDRSIASATGRDMIESRDREGVLNKG